MSSFFDNRTIREASHLNGFSGNLIERWSEARGEADLAKALAADNAAIYLFIEDRALLRVAQNGLNPRFSRTDAEALGLDAASVVLLGIAPQGPCLAGTVARAAGRPDDVKAIDLRSLAMQAVLDPADLAARRDC